MFWNYTMDYWSQTHGRVTLSWPPVYHLVVVGPSIVTGTLLTTLWKERPSLSRINDATLKQRCHATNSLNPLRCITPWWWSKALSCYVSQKLDTTDDGCVHYTRWIDSMHRPLVYNGFTFMDWWITRRMLPHYCNPCEDTVQISSCRTHMINTW